MAFSVLRDAYGLLTEAPLLNVYEEPHDGDSDFVKIRYPYRVRFAATNFKKSADWLG